MSLPESLGRLRRIRRLGAGGFASVWPYHDDELDSPVAVKALADNWAQQLDVRERFLREAQVLRRTDSAHVVQVYDLAETPDGTPYFVMSYADRGTVADLVDGDGPPDVATTVELVGQAARGVADLHASGVIHRDIKPPNLLLRSDHQSGWRLLVADLGVAKAMLYASGMTQVVGTPAYMAPEQADRGAEVSGRADVHALGAVTYELLTGRPIREELVGERASGEPEPPSAYADVPPGVDDTVLRAVRYRPEERWADPMAFADALRDATGRTGDYDRDAGAAAHTPVQLTPPAHRPRRRSLLAGVCALVLAAALGVGAYQLWPDDAVSDASTPSAGGDLSPWTSKGSRGGEPGYCTVLDANWDLLGSMKRGTPSSLGMIEEVFHQIRIAAPPELEAAWAHYDDPLQDLVALREKTGTTWKQLLTNTLDPKYADQFTGAFRRTGAALGDYKRVNRLVEVDAKRRCGLDLDGIHPQSAQ